MTLDFISKNPEHYVNLMGIDLERKTQNFPQEMSILLTINEGELEVVNDFETKMLVSIQVLSKEKENEEEDGDEKAGKEFFSLKVIYMVHLKFDRAKYEEDNSDVDLGMAKKYSLFILYPKLRDEVDRLFNQMGLPNANIPFRALMNDNQD